MFLALKTDGEIRQRANAVALVAGLATVLLAVLFLVWTQVQDGDPGSLGLSVVAAGCLVGALLANRRGREGWAFVGTAATIALAVVALFTALYPDVMPSTTDPAFSLTITNASSTPYTLGS